jgi:hypothetical protein
MSQNKDNARPLNPRARLIEFRNHFETNIFERTNGPANQRNQGIIGADQHHR